MKQVILAAGAIVWRKHKEKFTEVAIIHRPKYDDWTFPKGKCEVNEALIACAHREVLEETNIHTEFGAYLGQVEYSTTEGRKQVSYWSAKVIDEKTFTANAEVDEIKWVAVTKVRELLSMETDKEILDKFMKVNLVSADSPTGIDLERLLVSSASQVRPVSKLIDSDIAPCNCLPGKPN